MRLTSFINDGLTFDVIDEGPADGPVIVALHGFPERASMWTGVIPLLTDAGFRVLAPDQRGYSPDARPIGARNYTVERLAGDALALADAAGATRFHVLSHDWGSIVGWHLAGAHPDRVMTASILSVPHPKAFFKAMPRGQILSSWPILLTQLPLVPEWLFGAGDGWVLRRIAKPALRMSDEMVTGARELFGNRDAATAVLNWYRAMRFSPRLAASPVRVPTLYIWSTDDPAMGRTAAELTADYVEAPYRLEIFEGVSHWIAEEQPVRTAALVLDHIAEHTS